MSVFSTEQLNRYSLKAEQSFANEFNCLIDRRALDITEDVSLYILADDVINIRRITYRGKKLDPISHRDLREAFVSSFSSGTPTHYIYNNVGQNTIKLFPTPTETLTNVQADLLNPEVIRLQCIAEFYATADGIYYKLPDYIRRRLLKASVLKQAFLAEGKGQNLKAAKYWDQKWKYLKELYGEQIHDQLNMPRRLMANGGMINRGMLLPPMLPISMQGVGVNPGE